MSVPGTYVCISFYIEAGNAERWKEMIYKGKSFVCRCKFKQWF